METTKLNITTRLLNIFDTYNSIYENIKSTYNFNDDININHNKFIDNISNVILLNDAYKIYDNILETKTKISNLLITEILNNSPLCDVNLLTFKNIKTILYPYQINNLNWMINIENKSYEEELKEISSKIIFKGGGLFDEVGMGKTLQIITLINNQLSQYTSLVKNNKIYSKATLIIVPNHLCGQWLREFELHTIKPLNIINLLTKKHYKKYTYFDFTKADIVIVSSNFFINCNLNQHEYYDPIYNIINIFNPAVNIYNIYCIALL